NPKEVPMKPDKFIKIMLVTGSLLLLVNLETSHISLVPQNAYSQVRSGANVACSGDGKYVYLYNGETLYKSDNFAYTFYRVDAIFK
ncbi:MAG: hypothetical protein ABID54_05315, partial [Pseudomonadota bacterium]